MLRTTVYIDEVDKRVLEAKSRRTGLSEAEIIRRALRGALHTEDRQNVPAFVGLGASEPGVAKLDKRAMRKQWASDLGYKGN